MRAVYHQPGYQESGSSCAQASCQKNSLVCTLACLPYTPQKLSQRQKGPYLENQPTWLSQPTKFIHDKAGQENRRDLFKVRQWSGKELCFWLRLSASKFSHLPLASQSFRNLSLSANSWSQLRRKQGVVWYGGKSKSTSHRVRKSGF